MSAPRSLPMTLADLLAGCRQRGITLTATPDGRLTYLPVEAMSTDLYVALKAHKAEVVAWLSAPSAEVGAVGACGAECIDTLNRTHLPHVPTTGIVEAPALPSLRIVWVEQFAWPTGRAAHPSDSRYACEATPRHPDAEWGYASRVHRLMCRRCHPALFGKEARQWA